MRAVVLAAAVLAATPAWAQDGLRFCPNRPDLGLSTCTTDPGHVQLEVSAFDWTRTRDDDQREDTTLVGDLQVRLGVTRTAEVQLAWSPYGRVRTRDRATGAIDRRGVAGDLTLGFRQNLRNPDGDGLSISVQPQVTLPVGKAPLGAGTWGAGLAVPINIDLREGLALVLTNQADAAPDEDGRGRHFAFAETVGLSFEATDSISLVGEVQVEHDRDPAERQTRVFAAGSMAWQPRPRLQFDMLVGAGLNRAADDVRILAGGAVGF